MINENDLKAMKTRVSYRNFKNIPLNEIHLNLIEDYLENEDNYKSPFGNRIKIELIKNRELASKIGTYGLIKNANTYLVAVSKGDEHSLIDLGFVVEKLILYLENLQIATCWIAGTFNRKKLLKSIELKDGEIISAICPIGYSENKKRLIEKVQGKILKSNKRKDFNELFYQNDFNHPILDESIQEKLEYVRIAPSSKNLQPWRILMTEDSADFYISKERYKEDKLMQLDVQKIDLGIALCHYILATGKTNIFKKQDFVTHDIYKYLFSVEN